MHSYIAWTPMTNTVEVPRILPQLTDPPTQRIPLLDLPPAVEPVRRDLITRALRLTVAAIVAVDLAGAAYVAATQL